MGATSISWCDHSINPIRARHRTTGRTGHYCEKVSQGCKHCYSSRLQSRFGMPPFEAPHTSEIEPFFDAKRLNEVLSRKKPTRYFWCDMTDMFGSWVPDNWIGQCLETMLEASQHTHLLLTKRPERMQQYLTHWLAPALLPCILERIWFGVSVENQATADARIPWLLKTPCVVRFVSYEPALEAVDFTSIKWHGPGRIDSLTGRFQDDAGHPDDSAIEGLSWVICGGESGPKARGCDMAWLLSTVEQCRQAHVPVFCKQLGSVWARQNRAKDHKGASIDEFPSGLQVQEFPCAA